VGRQIAKRKPNATAMENRCDEDIDASLMLIATKVYMDRKAGIDEPLGKGNSQILFNLR
jgi:hypothetical protein